MTETTGKQAGASPRASHTKPSGARDGWAGFLFLVNLVAFVVALFNLAWLAMAMLAISFALVLLLDSRGKAWRKRHRLPAPGLLIAPIALVLLFAGMNEIGEHGRSKVARVFAGSGEQRIAQAREAMETGAYEVAERALEPIAQADDPRVEPLQMAIKALKAAKGDKGVAIRALESKWEEGETGASKYLLAARAIDPEEAQAVEIEFQTKLQAAAETKEIARQFRAWDGSHSAVVAAVKRGMNDPSSFKHVETKVSKGRGDTLVVLMTYRGANAFGGVVTEHVMARVDRSGNLLEIAAAR